MRREGLVRWTRGGFFLLAGVLGLAAWTLLVGGVDQFHRRVDRGGYIGHGPALFGIGGPWQWTNEARLYLVVATATLFVATMGLSHRIVTGRGSPGWEYGLLVVPIAQLVVARMCRRIREGTPDLHQRQRVARAVPLVVLPVVANWLRFSEVEIPWDDPTARFVEVTRWTEVLAATQVLVLVAASTYAIAALPTTDLQPLTRRSSNRPSHHDHPRCPGDARSVPVFRGRTARLAMRAGRRRTMVIGVVVAMAAVSACGDDDDSSSEAGSAAQFCAEFGPLNDEGDALFSGSDVSSEELDDLLERMRNLDPPAEIADDFSLLIEAFTLVSRSASGDSGAEAELTERFDEFDEAEERLEPFMRDTCDLDYGD